MNARTAMNFRGDREAQSRSVERRKHTARVLWVLRSACLKLALMFSVGLLVWVCLTPALMSQESPASELAEKAFSKRNYPWLYRETGKANFDAEFSTQAKAETRDRSRVKKAPPQSQSATTVPRAGGGGAGLTAAIAIGSLILLLAIAAAAWFLLPSQTNTHSLDEGYQLEGRQDFGADRVEELPFNVKHADGDFQAAAQRAYQSGDYRGAMTFLFSHILLMLDRHDHVRLKRGKTNRQYLQELNAGKSPELSRYYENNMLLFESVFFGNHDLQKRQFEECWTPLSQFHQKLAQPVRPANV